MTTSAAASSSADALPEHYVSQYGTELGASPPHSDDDDGDDDAAGGSLSPSSVVSGDGHRFSAGLTRLRSKTSIELSMPLIAAGGTGGGGGVGCDVDAL